MKYAALDIVVLVRDISDHSLRAGDVGTVVELHEPDHFEVEFVDTSGRTNAVLTLSVNDVRPATESDLVAVPPPDRRV